MKKNITPDLAETTVLSSARDDFAKMRKSAENFNVDINQIELYKKAQNIEKQSENFYLQKANEIPDEYQKELFQKLAEEEKKHYFLLDNIIEFVSRPKQWLENAEWYHLDEY